MPAESNASRKRSFSERVGAKHVRTTFQLRGMDRALRNRLWNSLCITCWEWAYAECSDDASNFMLRTSSPAYAFACLIWDECLKYQVDTIPEYWINVQEELKRAFYKRSWNGVYDFIECVVRLCPDIAAKEAAISELNRVLVDEMSGWRFVEGEIAPITNEEEIASIEQSLSNLPDPWAVHLKKALELLSAKPKPDYRNSIKESISAVGSLCKALACKPKAKLGEALSALGRKIDLHGALQEGFKKLYGYTSDADGIRHELMDEDNLDFDDAKYMLVSCSAFCNYLFGKAIKADIKLHPQGD